MSTIKRQDFESESPKARAIRAVNEMQILSGLGGHHRRIEYVAQVIREAEARGAASVTARVFMDRAERVRVLAIACQQCSHVNEIRKVQIVTE